MKKNQWIYLAVAVGVYWYWWKNKKNKGVAAPIIQSAKSVATDVVDKMVDATEFKIDQTSFADQYAKDGMNCK
jgi:hypothetical protein